MSSDIIYQTQLAAFHGDIDFVIKSLTSSDDAIQIDVFKIQRDIVTLCEANTNIFHIIKSIQTQFPDINHQRLTDTIAHVIGQIELRECSL